MFMSIALGVGFAARLLVVFVAGRAYRRALCGDRLRCPSRSRVYFGTVQRLFTIAAPYRALERGPKPGRTDQR
jgi:hypothetical protein